MEILYKSEKKIMDDAFQIAPKDLIEKHFIIDFFKSLPIEDLKRLINYREINFNNQELYKESQRMTEKLNQLKNERVILLTAEMYLDNGIDDLSLGQI